MNISKDKLIQLAMPAKSQVSASENYEAGKETHPQA